MFEFDEEKDKEPEENDVEEEEAEENFQTFLQYLKERLPIEPIINPIVDQSVMAMITTRHGIVIGGVDMLPDDSNYMIIYLPLRYEEFPVRNQEQKIVGIAPSFTKIFRILAPIEWHVFFSDGFYLLDKTRPKDQAIATQYEQGIKQLMADESDIQIVSQMPPGLGGLGGPGGHSH